MKHQPNVNHLSPAEDKIALLRSLFRGRVDVYSVNIILLSYWVSRVGMGTLEVGATRGLESGGFWMDALNLARGYR
jgi:hypothetical protein